MTESSPIFSPKETKIFDPKDGFAPITNLWAVTDATVTRRDDQWWMYAAGKVTNRQGIDLFSASLPVGSSLAASGWSLTSDKNDPTKIGILAEYENSRAWDLKGGRHCPCYVKGWDPHRNASVERIYYAGGADNVRGPYTIGDLEWDGTRWLDQPEPAFVANEPWEHGSVYEPNVIYSEGKWKMWYVSGSNQENYLVQGFSESEDGRTNWSKHSIFFPAEERVFDFHVFPGPHGWEAVFARVWLGVEAPPPVAGLWWCSAKKPWPNIERWSKPVQILTAENRGWHSGPWKPSAHYSETDPNHLFVFFDGIYQTSASGSFPYAFTMGCLETYRPTSNNP